MVDDYELRKVVSHQLLLGRLKNSFKKNKTELLNIDVFFSLTIRISLGTLKLNVLSKV